MVFTNPIRTNSLPPFDEGSSLRSRRDSDAVGLQWRKNSVHARHSTGDRENMRLVQWMLNRLRLYKGTGATDGIRWADPKEYNPATAYQESECVRVSPTNAANITGINNGTALTTGGAIVGEDGFGPNKDKATAVLFAICVKTPKVLHETQPADANAPRNYRVHVPVWPEPDGDPDSPNNYWLLVGLYPITLNVCIAGVDTPYYVQAQPVPEEFLLGEGGESITGEGGEGIIGE